MFFVNMDILKLCACEYCAVLGENAFKTSERIQIIKSAQI